MSGKYLEYRKKAALNLSKLALDISKSLLIAALISLTFEGWEQPINKLIVFGLSSGIAFFFAKLGLNY